MGFSQQEYWSGMRWLDGITDNKHELSELQEMVRDKKAWSAAIRGVAKTRA